MIFFVCLQEQSKLSILLRAFVYLGVPLAPAKVEGPLSCLTFLGITLDCIRLEARLPLDKLVEIRSLLTDTVEESPNAILSPFWASSRSLQESLFPVEHLCVGCGQFAPGTKNPTLRSS